MLSGNFPLLWFVYVPFYTKFSSVTVDLTSFLVLSLFGKCDTSNAELVLASLPQVKRGKVYVWYDFDHCVDFTSI